MLAAKANFKILRSKAVESGWKNNYKCVFQQHVVLTIFPLKYPWTFRGQGKCKQLQNKYNYQYQYHFYIESLLQ